ncbi:MAG TPA: Ig-like domain-containing protein [Holophagaceae bacterium]|nr:Ig-like domain-containing protein [Holophagaceae bacterium]
MLGILAIGVVCSFIACSGGGGAAATVAAPSGNIAVQLHPSATEVTAGDSVSVTASVTGSTDTTVTWSVDGIPNGNTTVGIISGSGNTVTYTAPDTEGIHTILIVSQADSTKNTSTQIRVKAPKAAVGITLSPTSATLAVGASQGFTATVTNATNTSVTWTIDGLATGTSATGTLSGSGTTIAYTAPATAGSHLLVATSVADPTKTASATLTIYVPATISAVTVSPGTATLNVGTQGTFSASVTGTGAYSSAVTWSAQRGTITSAGLYTAPATGGSDSVTATSVQDPTRAGTAALTIVVPASITSIAVSPSSPSVTTGAQTQFTASVAGTGSYSSAVTWSAQRGTVSTTGLYTAPATTGGDTVTATSVQDPTKSATATVAVAAPNSVTAVALSPTTASLNTGTQTTFTATVTGTGTYSSAVAWTAQRGTITSTGLYTAPATGGSDTVTATSTQDPTKAATASLTITVPSTITAVTVNPTTAALTTGSQATFTASVTGTGTYSASVRWTAQRGTITSTGLYTAPTTGGSDTVTATSTQDTTKTATASLSITVPVTVTSVAVTPSTTSLNTGAQQAFTATITGTGAYSSAVTWTAQRGTITSAGLYTAPATTGSDVVTAASVQDPSKAATASITVTAPPAVTSVSVSPSVLATGLSAQTTFTATVAGTGSYNPAVTWTAQRGTITSTGVYTSPATSGSDVVTATSVQDPTKAATASVTVTAPATVTSVTVSPSSLTLSASTQTQLSVTVSGTGSYGTGVTWAAQLGTVSTTGLYTAPAAGGTDTVTATSVFDPTKSGFSILTVQAPVTIALSPSGTVQTSVSGTLSFTSNVSGTSNTGTVWSVDGITNGSSTVGTLAVSGNTATYTAPKTSGTHTLKATSVADATKSSTVSLVVNPGVDLGLPAAFPGCEGMGCGATGGRGGVVYTVNTLEDTINSGAVPWNGPNGPVCSLRDAMTKTGARTIVFSVGGTITLHSTIYPVPPNLTIAGQTAPGGGIQIIGDGTFGNGGALMYLGGNTILRYLRFRPGVAPVNTSLQGLSSITISMPTPNDVVIDHCSFQWDQNKAVSCWSDSGVQRNTLSWCLDAESLAAHSTGFLIGGFNMGQANLDVSSWDGHHNVQASIDHRLPYTNLKYGRWINNYVFGYSYAGLIRGGTQFDIIGNVWDGIDAGIKATTTKAEIRWADTVAHNENNIIPGGTAQIYMANNFGRSNPTGSLDNFNSMLRIASSENSQLDNNPVSTAYKATAPTIPATLNGWPITITPLTVKEDLKRLLLPTVGASQRLQPDGSWVFNRDALDARILAYIQTPSTSPTTLIASPGTLPVLDAGTPIVSTVKDGIPDAWKTDHGLSISDGTVANTIRPNAKGFTILELYLSGLFPIGTPLP